jgi:methionyl-tRNA formyltransferase
VLTQAISIAFVGIIKFFTSYPGVLAKPQDNSLATYTLLLKRDDGYISSEILSESLKNGHIETSILPIYTKYLSRNKISIEQIPRQVSLYTLWKALHPWPGVWTIISHDGAKKRLKILTVDSSNQMKILKVQLEGKQPISWDEFTLNYSLQ